MFVQGDALLTVRNERDTVPQNIKEKESYFDEDVSVVSHFVPRNHK